MKEKIIIVLLGFGALAGFGSAIAGAHAHHRHDVEHLARVCAQAAVRGEAPAADDTHRGRHFEQRLTALCAEEGRRSRT